MPSWLLDRLFKRQEQPSAQFAFQGTVNWMRALAILADDQTFSNQALQTKYLLVRRRKANPAADTLAFEMLLMGLHNLYGLKSLCTPETDKYGIVRSAIISWYYCTYYSSKAMIASCSGSDPQTHAKSAKVWQSDIVEAGLAVKPFSFMLSNVVTQTVNLEIAGLRQGNKHDLSLEPKNQVEALGAALSYLKGTAEYIKWQIEEEVKTSRSYRELAIQNFRTAAARAFRDEQLRRESVNFLVQAFRYRGKANYRDSIYLSYGADRTGRITSFVSDLSTVAERFLTMAAHYVARRTERGTWQQFVADMDENLRFESPIDLHAIT
ncbi:hypothetical protein [Zwartia sp.]|uniref:hypothetical protein n=1 Tax=Zwartia sp. TaxID=2978004 RepID=UPI00271A3927|nr:hypothetical protein [Zwartia sp.]MDO9023019.1 hypothetical protein [Zwartia sp.]